MLVRNLAGVQGLSMKAGRQYVVFGNHSLFGHFDWANTGYSHDGVMLQYSTKSLIATWAGSGTRKVISARLHQSAARPEQPGDRQPVNNGTANSDADMIIFYNQIKSVPGFLIEPYYVLYKQPV